MTPTSVTKRGTTVMVLGEGDDDNYVALRLSEIRGVAELPLPKARALAAERGHAHPTGSRDVPVRERASLPAVLPDRDRLIARQAVGYTVPCHAVGCRDARTGGAGGPWR